MSAIVHFIGIDEPLVVEMEFSNLASGLIGQDPIRTTSSGGRDVVIYKPGVAYIEDIGEGTEPTVDFA